VLAGRLERGHGSAEVAAAHQARSLRRGAGGQLQGIGKMFGQPLAALGQGLGMGEHLTDAADRTAAEQGMANRQNQGSPDSQFLMLPEGIQTGRDPALDRVLDGHHGCITVAVSEGPDHGPVPALGGPVPHRPILQGQPGFWRPARHRFQRDQERQDA